MLRALCLILLHSAIAGAQQPAHPTSRPVTGTYVVGPVWDPSCSLEVAAIHKDSVRVQLYCTHGPPGYHSGFMDARLPIRGNTLLHETSAANQLCRIRIRFDNARAAVTQDGSDIACGFGGSVNVAGTYRRISRRQPRFDLNPVRS
jgi:hypothetical protein